MKYNDYEHEIKFALERVKSIPSKDGKDKYRAHLVHERWNEQPKDVKEDYKYWQMRQYFDELCLAVMKDGATRRVGDLFEVRLDIEGTFDRADSAFDKNKHNCRLNIVPLKGMKEYGRQESPKNVQSAAEGKIDYVEAKGGEMYRLEWNKNVVIHGHDLKLEKYDYLRLAYFDRRGDKHEYGVMWDEVDKDRLFVTNTDELLEVKWFGPDFLTIRRQEPKNAVLYVCRPSLGESRGSRAAVTITS